MGAVGSRQLNPAQLGDHQQATGLSAEQLEQLHTRFRSLDRHQRGYLTPTDLLRIPQLSLNPLHRQIVDGFFPSRDPSARLYFAQFVETCATFLVPQFGRSSSTGRRDGRAQKLRLLTKMFDTRRSGCITRDDFRQIMRSLLDPIWNPPQDQTPSGEGQDRRPEVEAELQLLEQQAFGFSGCDQISYAEFEQRLHSADVAGRLSIVKWLVDDDEARMGLQEGSSADQGQ
ncbi:calcineurin B homologous protein 1 [Drosophila suzukii]|uniref:Calcineurin B homologous protein 1 n=1 Tax=Drosophila suzukii TaxID=28584 RepID=A0AB40DIB2_DROSZ|nr:calcineurin B homologous protein 1 [Drosophila suzukii]XP_036676142.1 calcineurin B homologous protein 1 [Drosophila suzukii]XP_036676143.1 calcineurin B homologous protein 1 [Drosophila suzukii]XP_036676144.1 calcineurin B homologous protein 1 [Drosophila suzukii]XP_036676145.1 calcineurin B homologous protein 1 [Drosophila suzukii]XP_036676146.1 calcineurin B homologous protein 1 [Drosophila suzukii]XP_036676147.1 calcineurin B homologous protein 1 [Drosophila suzukii]XP_036676148.1 cal